MIFKSILFPETACNIKGELLETPDYFKDLNLDQIIESIIGKQEYLKPFFYTLLHDIDVIQYRHEVMQDLECEILFEKINSFAGKIYRVNESFAVTNEREGSEIARQVVSALLEKDIKIFFCYSFI